VEDYERRYLLSLEGERPALMGERKQKICNMYDNLRGRAPGQERGAGTGLGAEATSLLHLGVAAGCTFRRRSG